MEPEAEQTKNDEQPTPAPALSTFTQQLANKPLEGKDDVNDALKGFSNTLTSHATEIQGLKTGIVETKTDTREMRTLMVTGIYILAFTAILALIGLAGIYVSIFVIWQDSNARMQDTTYEAQVTVPRTATSSNTR